MNPYESPKSQPPQNSTMLMIIFGTLGVIGLIFNILIYLFSWLWPILAILRYYKYITLPWFFIIGAAVFQAVFTYYLFDLNKIHKRNKRNW